MMNAIEMVMALFGGVMFIAAMASMVVITISVVKNVISKINES